MKKDSELYKKIRVQCYIVGLIAFLTALIVGVFLLHNLEKDKRQPENIWRRLLRKESGQDWISIACSLNFWEIISVQEKIWMKIHFLNWQKRFLMKME